MMKLLFSEDMARGATVVMVILTSALLGQFAAAGITMVQWAYGLTAIAGSIASAVMVRCWPRASRQVELRE